MDDGLNALWIKLFLFSKKRASRAPAKSRSHKSVCNGYRSGKLTVDGTCPACALSLRKRVKGRADE